MLLSPGFVALAAHVFILYSTMISPVGINFGFYSSLSLISASIALLTLLSSVRHPIEIMGIIVMPIAAATIIIDTLQSTSHIMITGGSDGLLFHIISSIVAYSILGLAAVHAVVLSVQNRFLHRHQPGGFIRFLPPLKTMESLLFEIIIIGFIGLSISLASGFIFCLDCFRHIVVWSLVHRLAWAHRRSLDTWWLLQLDAGLLRQ